MKRIAFLSYDWDFDIMAAYYSGMQSYLAQDQDVRLVVFHAYGLYEKLDLQAGAYRVFDLCDLTAFDGFIIQGNRMWPPDLRTEVVARIRELGKPVVSLNYEIEGATCVGSSNYDAMSELVSEVLRTQRCTRPCFVNGHAASVEAQARKQAFFDACEAAGIKDPLFYQGEWEMEAGVRVAHELLARPSRLPDVIFCCNDDLAAGVQETLLAAGVRVPEDVRISGFDNRENSLRAEPRITTVDRDYVGAGRLALAEVVAQLEGAEVVPYVPSATHLVLSESCGYAPDLQFQANMAARYYTMDHELKDFYQLLCRFQPALLSADSLQQILDDCERYLPSFHLERFYLTLNSRYLDSTEADAGAGYGEWSLLVATSDQDAGLTADATHVYARFRSTDLLPESIPLDSQLYLVFPLRHNAQCIGTLVAEGLPTSLGYGLLTFVLTLLSNSIASVRQRLNLQTVNERLSGLYVHDQLTGLFNRFGMDRFGTIAYDHLLRDFDEAQFVFVDIDDMKGINDVHGHEMGDQAIRDAARVIERACFNENAFAMRYGGDEFLLICRRDLSARIADELAELKRASRRPYDLSLSVGVVSVSKDEGLSIKDAVERADAAMYEIKRTRKQQP